jgi:hypothetical protein
MRVFTVASAMPIISATSDSQATLKKVVGDRRASLDEETTIRKLVETEFARGANIPVVAQAVRHHRR